MRTYSQRLGRALSLCMPELSTNLSARAAEYLDAPTGLADGRAHAYQSCARGLRLRSGARPAGSHEARGV